jgi:TonB-linked SusC/RagA family outer membrane protein
MHKLFKMSNLRPWVMITSMAAASPLYLIAQSQQTIQGKVISNGQPVSGVVIKSKQSNLQTQTDAQGEFSIKADIGNQLLISHVSYESKEITIVNNGTLNIDLIAKDQQIEEVTIIGYGQQRTKDLTGSVSSVKADAYKDQPVLTAASALQGRAAGVAVSLNSGAPGGKAKIRIRGNNSISGSNDPLYIVDGIALSTFNLQDLNVNDIESMDVLKDASATAVYGSRGANGVVLITTKRGKIGATKVSYDGFVNFNTLPKRYELMDAKTYAEHANTIAGSTVIADPNSFVGNSTDWQEILFKNTQSYNHQVTVSGGGEKARFFVSGFYQNQDGTLLNTDQQKYGIRSNTDININEKLSLGINLSAQRINGHNNAIMTSKANPVMASIAWAPTEKPYEADGFNYNRNGISPIWVNPLLTALESDDNTFSNIAAVNGNIKYKIIEGLTFTSNVGLDVALTKSASLANNWVSPGNMRSSQGYAESYAFQNSNVLSFNKRFADKHDLTLTAVEESTISTSTNFNAAGSGLSTISNGYYNLGLNASQSISSGYNQWSLLSFLGRAIYSFDNKYLATVSVRRDGSSKFQGQNKWSNFPSFSLGWNVHQEKFLQEIESISQLKIRGGWGMTGNQAIGPYQTLGLLNPVNYSYGSPNSYQGYTIGNPTTENLKWETTRQMDIGFDLGLFNNRLTLVADYYNKDTEDLLLYTQIDKYLGGGSILKNVGSINNRGVEFAIDGRLIENDNLKWNSNFNIGFNKNKVVSLGEGEDLIRQPRMGGGLLNADIQVIKKGEALGAFYLIPWEGVYQQDDNLLNRKAGDYKYTDTNGDNAIGYDDMAIVGNATPKVQVGFTNTLSYKNFDFNVFIQGAYGHKITTSDVAYPTLQAVTDFWSPNNTGSQWASPTSKSKQYIESTQFLQDAGFTRIKNVSLSYKLPKSLLKVGAGSIGFSVQNLFTITKYEGFDPEASSTNPSSDTNIGIDLGAYPSPRTYTLRLNLTL